MESIQHIAKTALARKTRQVIQSVQRGHTVVVEHHGQPEAAILDIMDYYLLRAVLLHHTHPQQVVVEEGLSEANVASMQSAQDRVNLIIAHYLSGSISLSRAAELLQLSPLDLRTRFLRLDFPLRAAPESPDEILRDLETAAAFAKPDR